MQKEKWQRTIDSDWILLTGVFCCSATASQPGGTINTIFIILILPLLYFVSLTDNWMQERRIGIRVLFIQHGVGKICENRPLRPDIWDVPLNFPCVSGTFPKYLPADQLCIPLPNKIKPSESVVRVIVGKRGGNGHWHRRLILFRY